jgi:hypothetical protein
MGFQKACIVFVAGIFFISLITKNLSVVKDIPILGPIYGDITMEYLKKYKMHGLLMMISALIFII